MPLGYQVKPPVTERATLEGMKDSPPIRTVDQFLTTIAARIDRSVETLNATRDHADSIARIAEVVSNTFQNDGTLLTCGNGGSAAEALHFSEELIGRFNQDRPPLRSVCLNADTTALTCIANDYGFEEIYSRQCMGLGRPGDALAVFSTSGNSENIIRALKTAAQQGIRTIGFLGRDGGAAAELCSTVFLAPGGDSASIQESHQVALHAICNCFEPIQ